MRYFSNSELAVIAIAVLVALVAIQRIRDAAWNRKLKEYNERMRELDQRANYSANVIKPRCIL